VKGHNITHEEGEIGLTHVAPRHSDSKHLGDLQGEADGDGNHAVFEGPFTFDHGGFGSHLVDARRNDSAHSTESQQMNDEACEDELADEQPPACPANLEAPAQGNEDVRLGWHA
jgi:hypothetical protein